MTPAQRTMRARIAAHEQWAGIPSAEERQKRMAPKHAKSPVSVEYWRQRFRQEHPQLSETEVLAAAENAHTAYMTRLSMKAAAARARKKNSPA